MILLDAYALISLLAGEQAADEVGALIAEGEVAIAAPNLAEAADHLARLRGIEVGRTRAAVEVLELRVRATELEHGWRAGELRAKHYHRSRRPLSLGDCLLLAAVGADDRLATADPHVLATAEQEQLAWIALLDSAGERHSPAG